MAKKFNINKILIISVLLIAVIVLVFQRFTATKGNIASVQFSNSDKVYEISLDQNDTYTITEGEYPVYLEVKDAYIRFYNSQCPDHLCEDFGLIGEINEYAICMPAGVAVLIEK